ncbi:hypothetical protein V6N13_103584 [Hibiscus sabdariffa]
MVSSPFYTHRLLLQKEPILCSQNPVKDVFVCLLGRVVLPPKNSVDLSPEVMVNEVDKSSRFVCLGGEGTKMRTLWSLPLEISTLSYSLQASFPTSLVLEHMLLFAHLFGEKLLVALLFGEEGGGSLISFLQKHPNRSLQAISVVEQPRSMRDLVFRPMRP